MKKIRQHVHRTQDGIFYQVTMAVLAFASVGMLAYEFFGNNVAKSTIELMNRLDLSIAYIFLTDFSIGVIFAQKRLRHIYKNWLDLLGSIPFTDSLFRAMRIFRFARLVRLLRVANAGLNVEDTVVDIYKNSDNDQT